VASEEQEVEQHRQIKAELEELVAMEEVGPQLLQLWEAKAGTVKNSFSLKSKKMGQTEQKMTRDWIIIQTGGTGGPSSLNPRMSGGVGLPGISGAGGSGGSAGAGGI